MLKSYRKKIIIVVPNTMSLCFVSLALSYFIDDQMNGDDDVYANREYCRNLSFVRYSIAIISTFIWKCKIDDKNVVKGQFVFFFNIFLSNLFLSYVINNEWNESHAFDLILFFILYLKNTVAFFFSQHITRHAQTTNEHMI